MKHLSPPLTLAIFGTSLKEDEQRVPIHPEQIKLIPQEVRNHLIFEQGYGLRFGISDSEMVSLSCRLAERKQLFEISDAIVLLKPTQQDFDAMREGSILWGCPHVVEQFGFLQSAIKRKLTLIAVESMYIWSPKGERLFLAAHKAWEAAGYAAVLDALRNLGIDGHYGPPRKSIIFGFGSVGHGAVYGLQALGFQDIQVFTFRHPNVVINQIPGPTYHNLTIDDAGHMMIVYPDGSTRRAIDEIVSADIIVNAIDQDMNNPKMIIASDELDRELKRGSVIIDVSCAPGIGFPFARVTTFKNPFIRVGNSFYYSVDHTPSYLWNSVSWEISKIFIHYLPIVMGGPQAWEHNETIRRAIDIREGVLLNEEALLFYNHATDYSHQVLSPSVNKRAL